VSDQQPARPQGPGRNPWVTAFLILVGVVLLLPGLCSLIFSVAILRDSGSLGGVFGSLLIFFLFVGAGGVALIVFAVRR
jgi:Na+/H+-dicarboxylate symporter